MGLTGSTTVGLVAWLRDLTYAEVHAATVGAMHATAVVVLAILALQGIPYAGEAAIALTFAAFALLGYVPKADATNVPGVARILEAIPPSIKGQIRDEAHYYGGFALGTIVVELVAYVAFTLGWFPGL